MTAFALLHSIFLSPRSWAGVRHELEAAGDQAQLLDCRAALQSGGSYYGEVARIVADQLSRQSMLVVHSAAGAVVPEVIASAAGSVAGVVFVDALLPHPGRSWLDTAPEHLRGVIGERASNDMVPPWPRLLPSALLQALIPDVAMRSTLVAESPGVPLPFLRELAPSSDLPADMRPWYIQLSSSYDDEAETARTRGWPVSRIAGDHLWTFTHPREVAKVLRDMVSLAA